MRGAQGLQPREGENQAAVGGSHEIRSGFLFLSDRRDLYVSAGGERARCQWGRGDGGFWRERIIDGARHPRRQAENRVQGTVRYERRKNRTSVSSVAVFPE